MKICTIVNKLYLLQEWSPLYDDCSISMKESELLLMAMALRHNFPDIALEHTVQAIDCHLPHVEYGSKCKFLKEFPTTDLIEYYYCEDCHNIITFGNRLIQTCNLCKKNYNKNVLKKDGKYFINISLKKQLEEMVNSNLYLDLNTERSEDDVINTSIYKQLKENNIIKENDRSIQFNVDGVSLFNSSKVSMWPILVTVNELSYRSRKKSLCFVDYGAETKSPV